MSEENAQLRSPMLDHELKEDMADTRLKELVFRVGELTFAMTADQLKGRDDAVITLDPYSSVCTVRIDGADHTEELVFTCTDVRENAA